jgi:PAS domain S-box-containing protein
MDTKTKELEEKLLSIFNSISDGICVVDKTGKITYINKTITEIGGWTEGDLVGKRLGLLKVFSAKDMLKILDIFTKRMTGKEIPPYEISVKIKGGGEKIVEIHAATLKVKGEIVGDVAILRDLTERKKANEELKDSEERLKIIFDFAPEAYFVYDSKGTFIDGNKAAEKLSGYKKEELLGKSFFKLNMIPLSQIPKVAKLVAENYLGKSTGPDEFNLMKKDGKEIVVEIRTCPINIKGQALVIGITHDVTEYKRILEELEKKNEELEKFNKLAIGREMRIIELKNKIKEGELKK